MQQPLGTSRVILGDGLSERITAGGESTHWFMQAFEWGKQNHWFIEVLTFFVLPEQTEIPGGGHRGRQDPLTPPTAPQ